jgi:glucose-1-phosphate cytidylyltransferase
MKIVILAGGLGTRLSEETEVKPKPMIEIGGRPILWHIMKLYSHFGYNDFIICLGYKGYYIKEYFAHYFLHESDVTFDFIKNNEMTIHKHKVEPWRVTLIDTGLNTMTGGRIKRIQSYIGNETFMLTYGDGVSDIDINKLVELHRRNNKYATITSVQPLGRFGALNITEGSVISFIEKPKGDENWINGGFFVLEPNIFNLINGDNILWEKEPLETLAKMNQLSAYKHNGFWRPMDTLRDKRELEEYWASGKAPWKLWTD